jgi:hypothetical protein
MNNAQKNAFNATFLLLKAIKFRFTKTKLKELLFSQRDFPKITAIREVLKIYKIKTLATVVSLDKLFLIPLPAIFHFKNGPFVMVKKINKKLVYWYHDDFGWQKSKLDEFKDYCDGAVIMAERTANLSEENFYKNRLKEILNGNYLYLLEFLFLFLLAFISFLSVKYDITKFSVLIIKSLEFLFYSRLLFNNTNFIFGRKQALFLSYRLPKLLIPDIRIYNNYRLFFSLLTFFLSGLIVPLVFPQYLTLVVWIEVVTTFVAILLFLVKIQIKQKAFIVLCIVIMFLFIKVIWLFHTKNTPIIESTNQIFFILYFFSFISFFLFITFINQYFQKSICESILFLQNYKKPHIENIEKEKLPPIFENMSYIEIGEPSSNKEIIAIINPSCIFSAYEFDQLLNLSKICKNFSIKINFNCIIDDKVAENVCNLILSKPKEERVQLLRDWFFYKFSNLITQKKFFKEKDKTISGDNFFYIPHKKWSEIADVINSPTIYIDKTELLTTVPTLCLKSL